MINIYIGKEIQIEGLDTKLKTHICKSLTLPNPVYHKMLRKGNTRALFGLKKEFKYWREEGGVLIVPRGMRKRLSAFFQKCQLEYTLKEDFIQIKLKV